MRGMALVNAATLVAELGDLSAETSPLHWRMIEEMSARDLSPVPGNEKSNLHFVRSTRSWTSAIRTRDGGTAMPPSPHPALTPELFARVWRAD
jgi:hypothetical protein